jgi:putative FmdB family regulatory protein
MPLYEYIAADPARSCPHCAPGFDHAQRVSDPPLSSCPQCGAPVRKVFTVPSIGPSSSGLDRRAQNAGFHKLQRLGKGEYEKKY